MKRKSSEIWVGIFAVIGIILLVLMTLKIEKFHIGKEAGYLLNIYFDSVSGLEKNSPVRVAGVRVGNVEKIALEQGKGKVTFRLPPEVVLYKDAKAYIKTEGFLGEKYVEISLESSSFLLLTARWPFERYLEIEPISQSFKVVDSYGRWQDI